MQQNTKLLRTIIYQYENIDVYIELDEKTEDIITVFCANTHRMFSRIVFLDVESDVVTVEYKIFNI